LFIDLFLVQVAEILANSKDRLSISGWFHGENIIRPPFVKELPLPASSISLSRSEDIEKVNIMQWINPLYLNEKTIKQMRRQFEHESCIELTV
jgi:hypothetical protein